MQQISQAAWDAADRYGRTALVDSVEAQGYIADPSYSVFDLTPPDFTVDPRGGNYPLGEVVQALTTQPPSNGSSALLSAGFQNGTDTSGSYYMNVPSGNAGNGALNNMWGPFGPPKNVNSSSFPINWAIVAGIVILGIAAVIRR